MTDEVTSHAALFQLTGVGVVQTDLESGRFLRANEAFCKMVGYSEAELQAMIHLELTHPDDRERQAVSFAALQRREGGTSLTRCLHKDGRVVWLELHVTVVGEGDEAMSIVVVNDVTEGKQAEERLCESEERFRAMFEQANVGIVQVSFDGKLLMPNPSFCEFIGYTEEEVRRLNLHDITHPDDYRVEIELTRRLLRGKIPSFLIEKRYLRKDGGVIWGSMSATVVRRATGEPFYALAVVEDISERKRVEEVLQEAHDRLKGDVAVRTAQVQALATDLTLAEQRERQRISQLLHDELQQQLFALQMMVKGLLGQTATLEIPLFTNELNEVYSLTKTSLATTRTLVSELSPAALLEGDLEKALVWLAEHIQARHALKVTLVSTEGIIPKLPNALGVLLFQCVQELLFNVVKHAQAEHAVVMLRRYPDGLQLEVQDDGRGFVMRPVEPNAPRQEVFGLQSVQQRLKAFSGVVKIDSVLGNGTRVTIVVPLS
jgi:PAS domain S-box-containing protein